MISFKKAIGVVTYWATWPGLYLALNNTHRVRVIINVGDKVLFVSDWLGDIKLSLPGGGIKKGEKPEVAACREVFEETGIKLDVAKLNLMIKDKLFSENGIKTIINCYHITMPKVITPKNDDLEILESLWIPWQKEIDSSRISNNTNSLLHIWLKKSFLID